MQLGNREQIRLMVIVVCLIIIFSNPVGVNLLIMPLSSFEGYITGYEGAKCRFAGIKYTDEEGDVMRDTNPTWDTTFTWDPDERGKGKPAIAGEMTTVFVARESLGKVQSTLGKFSISDWLVDAHDISNPVEVYEWTLEGTDVNESTVYRMEEWQLKWYFSISCEPIDAEISPCWVHPCALRNSLKPETEIWFEFDIRPMWFFENVSTSYFAFAKVQVSDIALGGVLDEEYTPEHDSKLRVLPMSKKTPLALYYDLFGVSLERAEKEAYTYQGKQLNPDLFRDRIYTYFTLQDFGVSSWLEFPLTFKWRGDVVTVGFDVHLFVIGEWKVKDIQELPDEYGRTAKYGFEGVPFGDWLAGMWADPLFNIWMFIILCAIVFLFLAIFAPSVLFGLFGVARSRASRGSKRR